MENEVFADKSGLRGMMKLIELSEKRKEMHRDMSHRSKLADMNIPYSLAVKWLETEREYQIHLANIEASKQASIIKQLSKENEDLKRGIRS